MALISSPAVSAVSGACAMAALISVATTALISAAAATAAATSGGKGGGRFRGEATFVCQSCMLFQT